MSVQEISPFVPAQGRRFRAYTAKHLDQLTARAGLSEAPPSTPPNKSMPKKVTVRLWVPRKIHRAVSAIPKIAKCLGLKARTQIVASGAGPACELMGGYQCRARRGSSSLLRPKFSMHGAIGASIDFSGPCD